MTLPSLQLIPDATNLNDDDVLVVGLGTTDAGISVRAEGLAPDVVESILSSAQKIQAD